MPDMLVKLYELPALSPGLDSLRAEGIEVRRAYPYELTQAGRFVTENFGRGWGDEVTAGFARLPISIFVAHEGSRCLGFASYDCTTRNYFGPEGVLAECRGRGVGKALLLSCLHAMASDGYAYAIIGAAGPVEFYRKTCGATV
jgi:hypothetical protein